MGLLKPFHDHHLEHFRVGIYPSHRVFQWLLLEDTQSSKRDLECMNARRHTSFQWFFHFHYDHESWLIYFNRKNNNFPIMFTAAKSQFLAWAILLSIPWEHAKNGVEIELHFSSTHFSAFRNNAQFILTLADSYLHTFLHFHQIMASGLTHSMYGSEVSLSSRKSK